MMPSSNQGSSKIIIIKKTNNNKKKTTGKNLLSYLYTISCFAQLQVETYEFCITYRLIREIYPSPNSFSWLGEKKKNRTKKVQ